MEYYLHAVDGNNKIVNIQLDPKYVDFYLEQLKSQSSLQFSLLLNQGLAVKLPILMAIKNNDKQ